MYRQILYALDNTAKQWLHSKISRSWSYVAHERDIVSVRGLDNGGGGGGGAEMIFQFSLIVRPYMVKIDSEYHLSGKMLPETIP